MDYLMCICEGTIELPSKGCSEGKKIRLLRVVCILLLVSCLWGGAGEGENELP